MPYGSSILETIPESEDARHGTARDLGLDRAHWIGLLVLWNSDEPRTIGAFLPIAPGPSANTRIIGRGTSRQVTGHEHVQAILQRPQTNELLSPFESPSLSRVQLLIPRSATDRLELLNVGRRRLFVNGSLTERAEVRPGDVVEVGTQLTLLCMIRPRCITLPGLIPTFPFGECDAHGYVGESLAAWKLRAELAFAAPRRGHVIIFGDTGTGKELVANAVHRCSNRSGPLVARNAATIPETLVDAELFGNMKGYPNPGMPERKGLIGAAQGGTLFLDEFGDLPTGAQAHILRVLDAGQYHRLGEDSARQSDFRLVAATNRPESELRSDIITRFEFRLFTPNLAQRSEDIPLLMRHLLAIMSQEDLELRRRFYGNNGLPRLANGFVRQLVKENYTGNFRELRQLLWQALAKSHGAELQWPKQSSANEVSGPPSTVSDPEPARDALQRALDANNGSIEKTWRALGLTNRHVLTRLLRKHSVSITRQPGRD